MNTDEQAIARMSWEAEQAEQEAVYQWIEQQREAWGEGATAPTPEDMYAADVCMCEHEAATTHEPACPLYAPMTE